MVGLFTRLIEIIPLHDQTCESVIRAFEQGWIYRGHGVLQMILTDQGSQLDAEELRTFCRTLDVNKKHTTPYHPQCDGMAEGNIGFVKQVILYLLDRNMSKCSWPQLLPEVYIHCNSMTNASSKVSPFMLTYGRQPRSPIDLWCERLQMSEHSSLNRSKTNYKI